MSKDIQKNLAKTNFGYISSMQYSNKGLYFIDNGHLYFAPNNSDVSVRLFMDNVSDLQISPNQHWLSFVMFNDIYIYNIETTEMRRVTYHENPIIRNAEWDDNDHLFYSFRTLHRIYNIYKVNIQSKESTIFLKSDCTNISKSSSKCILQERGYAYEKWREYKGGAAARLLELDNNGNATVLSMPNHISQYNCYNPCCIGDRLFFIGLDANKIANVYEYHFDKQDVTQITFHTDFYVKYITKFGQDLIYTCGHSIQLLSIDNNFQSKEIDVVHKSCKNENKAYIDNIEKFATECSVNDRGCTANISSRGHVILSKLWSNTSEKITNSIRYISSKFISNNTVANIKNVFDEASCAITTVIEIYDCTKSTIQDSIQLSIGFVESVSNIYHNKLICSNHIGELYCIDLKTKKHFLICKGMEHYIGQFDLSPDGAWVTYSMLGEYVTKINAKNSSIYLFNLKSKTQYKITNDNFSNYNPSFSYDGKYILFISNKNYQPKYDQVSFNMYYNNTEIIRACAMHTSYRNPFDLTQPEFTIANHECDDDHKKHDDKKNVHNIDVNIHKVNEKVFFEYKMSAEYDAIHSVKMIKSTQMLVIVTNTKKSSLISVNLENDTNSIKTIASDVQAASYSNNFKYMIVIADNKVKVGKTDEEFPTSDDTFKKCGVVHFSDTYIDLEQERYNIFNEVWWFTKERFWSKEVIKNLNWNDIYNKYKSRLHMISTRHGLNQLLAEMLGELKTSHAYIIQPGDVDVIEPKIGSLGIEYTQNQNGGYVIDDFINISSTSIISPLYNYCKKGDIITHINGDKCEPKIPLDEYMANTYTQSVCVGYMHNDEYKQCYIKPLSGQTMNYAEYKQWIDYNEQYINDKTNGMVGYIHIPNMSSFGFNEFHLAYSKAQFKRAIIVDLRYNGGGHTSSLIFKILSNIQTLKGVVQDHEYNFPYESHSGNLVFLCNYSTGSDGDIGTQHAKRLGHKVIGTRTWGGVVGINVRDVFIDGGVVSFPEHAISPLHDNDKSANMENYGVDPDIHVENVINNYILKDHQMDVAIDEVLKLIESKSIKA